MNPFEYFLHLKEQILTTKDLIENIRTYAYTDRLLLINHPTITPLGAGKHNIHFHIGTIENIHLATREYIGIAYDEEDITAEYENYIDQIIKAHEQGKNVPRICGAIKTEIIPNYLFPRYFLIIEDITKNKTRTLQPAAPGETTGTIDGREIYYDFDTLSNNYPPTKYLAPENLLFLNK